VDRQQKLNKQLHDLMRFGDLYNALTLVTNQVMAKLDHILRRPDKADGRSRAGAYDHVQAVLEKVQEVQGEEADSPACGLAEPAGRRGGIFGDHGLAEGLRGWTGLYKMNYAIKLKKLGR
jgi:hypothetical protein